VLDDTRLAALRTALEAQRTALRHELESHGADPDADEVALTGDAGFSDRSHSTEERARVLAVTNALRSNLRDVEHALAKMDAGTYGTCESCGKPIDPERLEALPWAILCMECKQRGIAG